MPVTLTTRDEYASDRRSSRSSVRVRSGSVVAFGWSMLLIGCRPRSRPLLWGVAAQSEPSAPALAPVWCGSLARAGEGAASPAIDQSSTVLQQIGTMVHGGPGLRGPAYRRWTPPTGEDDTLPRTAVGVKWHWRACDPPGPSLPVGRGGSTLRCRMSHRHHRPGFPLAACLSRLMAARGGLA